MRSLINGIMRAAPTSVAWRTISSIVEPLGIFLVVDGSLISENAYFIRQREAGYENTSIRDIIREMMAIADLCYLSGRKSCSVRGGFIATSTEAAA